MPIPTKLAQAKLLATYWDNYVNYLTSLDDRQPGIGQGDPKPPQTPLYVKPFAYDLDGTQYIEVNGTASRWASWGSAFSPYTKDTLGAGETALDIRLSPARLIIKENVSTTKQVRTANTTKRKYITYGGKAGSVPFGLNTATDNEFDVYTTIRTALLAISGFDDGTRKISRVKEKA